MNAIGSCASIPPPEAWPTRFHFIRFQSYMMGCSHDPPPADPAMRDINEITGEIVDAAYALHTRIGPGLLESAYETLLAQMLEQRGLKVERQKPVSFEFEGIRIKDGFRVDLFVENRVVVELKSTERLARVYGKQVLTYLRLLDLPVGLLINFGAASLTDGLQRILNPRGEAVSPLTRFR